MRPGSASLLKLEADWQEARGLGRRIHLGVEVTESSTNKLIKQHYHQAEPKFLTTILRFLLIPTTVPQPHSTSSILGPPSAKRQGSFAMTLLIQKTHHPHISRSQKVRQSSILGPPSAKRQGSFAMTLRFQNHTSSFIILFYYYYYYY